MSEQDRKIKMIIIIIICVIENVHNADILHFWFRWSDRAREWMWHDSTQSQVFVQRKEDVSLGWKQKTVCSGSCRAYSIMQSVSPPLILFIPEISEKLRWQHLMTVQSNKLNESIAMQYIWTEQFYIKICVHNSIFESICHCFSIVCMLVIVWAKLLLYRNLKYAFVADCVEQFRASTTPYSKWK